MTIGDVRYLTKEVIIPWTQAPAYSAGDVVLHLGNGAMYKANSNMPAGQAFVAGQGNLQWSLDHPSAWTLMESNEEGDIRFHHGELYTANSFIPAGTAWAEGVGDNQWTRGHPAGGGASDLSLWSVNKFQTGLSVSGSNYVMLEAPTDGFLIGTKIDDSGFGSVQVQPGKYRVDAWITAIDSQPHDLQIREGTNTLAHTYSSPATSPNTVRVSAVLNLASVTVLTLREGAGGTGKALSNNRYDNGMSIQEL
jgi:hypothetical protein